MTYQDLVTSLATLAVLISAGVALFLFFQLAPVLSLRISPAWTDDTRQYLTIRFEVENKSRVRVSNPVIRMQVLEQPLSGGGALSDWVPFRQDRIRPSEPVKEWREPVDNSTTKRIYPGEIIAVERLYHYPQSSLILHIGLQVTIKLGLIGRIVTRKRDDWSQTTTLFLVK
jgi:hypothetical protein